MRTVFSVCALLLVMQTAMGNEKKATLTFDGEPVDAVIKKLETAYGKRFVFDKKLLANTRPVSAKLEDVTLAEAAVEVFRPHGICAVQTGKDSVTLVSQMSPLGMSKATGRAYRTVVELAIKLDKAEVVGDEINVPGWTQKDHERLARAIIDFTTFLLYQDMAAGFNYGRNSAKRELLFLKNMKSKLKSQDRDVRISGFLEIPFGPYRFSDNNKAAATAVLRAGLTDPDPLVRSAWCCGAIDHTFTRDIALEFAEKLSKGKHPADRFAASLLYASRAERDEAYAERLAAFKTDTTAANRVLPYFFDLIRAMKNDPAGFKEAIKAASTDKSPIIRAMAPWAVVMLRFEGPRTRRDAAKTVNMKEFITGKDGFSEFMLKYMSTWQKIETVDQAMTAIRSTEAVLKSNKFSQQLFASFYAPVLGASQAERAFREKNNMLMATLGQKALQPTGEFLLQKSTVDALWNSKNIWIRAVGIALAGGAQLDYMALVNGVIEPEMVQKAKFRFRRALASRNEFERAPALIFLAVQIMEIQRHKPIAAEHEMVLRKVWKSGRAGERLLAGMILSERLPFDQALAEFKTLLKDKRQNESYIWLHGLVNRLRSYRTRGPERKQQQLQLVDAVLNAGNPELERRLVRRAYWITDSKNQALFQKLIDKGSPEVLSQVADRMQYSNASKQNMMSFMKRLEDMSDSQKIEEKEAAADIYLQLLEGSTFSRFIHTKNGKNAQIAAKIISLPKRIFADPEKCRASRITLLCKMLSGNCRLFRNRDSEMPAYIRDTAVQSLGKIGQPDLQMASTNLLLAVNKLKNDLRANWKLQNVPALATAASNARALLLKKGAMGAKVRFLTGASKTRDQEATAILTDLLLQKKIPADLMRDALRSFFGSPSLNNNPKLTNYLFAQVDSPDEEVAYTAMYALSGAPSVARKLAGKILKAGAGKRIQPWQYTQILKGMLRRYGKTDPALADLVRSHVMKDLLAALDRQRKREKGTGVEPGLLNHLDLAAACGPSQALTQIYETGVVSKDLPDGVKSKFADGLVTIAPKTQIFKKLVANGYDGLSITMKKRLAVASAQAPDAPSAADFLVKALGDKSWQNRVYSEMSSICYNLKLKSTPELIKAFQTLRKHRSYGSYASHALRKLGVDTGGGQTPTPPPPEKKIQGLIATASVQGGNVAASAIVGKKILLMASTSAITKIDLTSGKALGYFKAPSAKTRVVAGSPDGKLIAVDNDHDIVLMDAANGKLIRTLKGHKKYLRSLNFSSDGKLLVSCSADKTVRVWTVATGKEKRQFKLKRGGRCTAISPDGQLLAIGALDRKVHVINLSTGAVVHELKGHTFSIRTVAFSPDGKTIASGSDDMKIILWDVAKGIKNSELVGHSSLITGLSFVHQGKALLSCSRDGSIRLWDAATAKETKRLIDGVSGFTTMSTLGSRVGVGNVDGKASVLELK